MKEWKDMNMKVILSLITLIIGLPVLTYYLHNGWLGFTLLLSCTSIPILLGFLLIEMDVNGGKPDWIRGLEERLKIAGEKLEVLYLIFIVGGMMGVIFSFIFDWRLSVVCLALAIIGAYLIDEPDWVKEERDNTRPYIHHRYNDDNGGLYDE